MMLSYDPNVHPENLEHVRNEKRQIGDIDLNKDQRKELKNGNRPKSIKLWPKSDDDLVYIPYKISEGFTKEQVGYIKAAFKEFEKYTCIR